MLVCFVVARSITTKYTNIVRGRMKVAVAADHAGFLLKNVVVDAVRELGHEPLDLGTFNSESVDYSDFAEKAGLALQRGEAERAVILCGSGVGICIAANKMKGVYAAICHDTYSAHQGVEHDNMNALCIGARVIGPEVAKELVKAFLSASFSPEPRFQRRADKVKNLEEQFGDKQ
jgi:ribose 5-phosphate isomerase B